MEDLKYAIILASQQLACHIQWVSTILIPVATTSGLI
jgi:hypothetical protein